MRGACRNCAPPLRLTEESLAALLARLSGARASVAERQRRLAICRACPDLDAGITCRHCSCLVPLRASLRDKNCPAPGGSRWG